MRYEYRPIERWADQVTKNRQRSQFRAHWSDTLDLLAGETEKLGAKLVVIQLNVVAGEIRRDGMLRANTRVDFPGVRIAFDSRYGPLTYSTDRYTTWQDNVRAIALSLQALRSVDRYGVNKRGEQYTGWLQLEASPGADVAEAQSLLDSYGGEAAALKATHPDRGGSVEAFRLVQRARETLAGKVAR